MLDKYTIFDNFDKLDLSPVAGRFLPRELNVVTGTPEGGMLITLDTTLVTGGSKIKKALESINYVKANETIYAAEGNARYMQQPEPYNMTKKTFGSLNQYLPDFFRYITNKRFYITNDLKIAYTKTGLQEDNTYLKGLFDVDFYFQFADIITLTRQLISNNYLYSKLPNVPEGESYVGLQTLLAGLPNSNSISFEGLLEQTPNGELNPFLGGVNKIIFQYHSQKNVLNVIDAIKLPGPNSQILYLSGGTEKSPTYINNLLALLQRFFYPIATQANTPPRHIYFVTDLKKAVNEDLVEDTAFYSDYDIVKVNSFYNFYKPYAEKFGSNVIAEWQLPNAYTYYSFLNSKKQNKLLKYYLDLVKISPFGGDPSTLNGILDEEFNFEKYYNFTNASIAPQIADLSTSEGAENFVNVFRNRNIAFGNNVQKVTKDVDALKKVFPYYNKIELPSINSNFMHKLQQQNLLDSFMSLICNYFGDRTADRQGKPISPLIIPAGVDYRKGPLHTFSGFSADDGAGQTNLFASTMQILDIDTLSKNMSKYKNYLFDDTMIKFASNSVFIPEKQEDSVMADYNVSVLSDVIKDYCNLKKLLYNDINEGKKCYSEMLGFEIVKSAFNNRGEKQILQSFFVPCIDDNPMSYIDTQVFYDKEYIYEIYSISLIVGSRYYSELGRENNLVGDNNQPEFSLNEQAVTLKNIADDGTGFPDFKIKLPPKDVQFGGATLSRPILVRAPYYNNISFGTQKKTRLLDKPPLPPEISFYPYKDIDNKVLIFLNINYGERKLFPIRVFPDDNEHILKYYQNQIELQIDKGSSRRRILYKTDDFHGTYKVYQCEGKTPTSWSDFNENPIAEITNSQNSGFENSILPNVDYYYFARFEDVHGNISNPTDIFKLRMVKEGGFPPYMSLKIYTFAENRGKLVRERTFKKYLKIRLADGVRKYVNTDDINKTNISYSKLVFANDPDLAPIAEQLKTYKIRITSKQTGKKIDINLDLKKNISERYLSKEIKTEKQSLALDLIDKEKNKAESKSNFVNMDDMASQYNEATKDFASTDDLILKTDTVISFVDKQN